MIQNSWREADQQKTNEPQKKRKHVLLSGNTKTSFKQTVMFRGLWVKRLPGNPTKAIPLCSERIIGWCSWFRKMGVICHIWHIVTETSGISLVWLKLWPLRISTFTAEMRHFLFEFRWLKGDPPGLDASSTQPKQSNKNENQYQDLTCEYSQIGSTFATVKENSSLLLPWKIRPLLPGRKY